MTLPAILWAHDAISEREPAHYWPDGRWDNARWEDCIWDSTVMWLRIVRDAKIPATHYESERLRQASGEDTHSGSNPVDVATGVWNRYKWTTPPRITGWTALRAALQPGFAAVIQGSMGAFPYGHRLRRFDAAFAGAHAVMGVKVDAQPRYWVTDPLAPEGSYQGEWWSEAELRRFVQALSGASHLVAKIKPKPAVVVPKPVPVQVVRVSGYFWDYTIHGTRTAGYTISRRQRYTAGGFSARLGTSRIDTIWSGSRRLFAKIVDPKSAYDGLWINLLDSPNVRLV